jgi:hypothetical protein
MDFNPQRNSLRVSTQVEDCIEDHIFTISNTGKVIEETNTGLIDSPMIKAVLARDNSTVLLKNSLKDTPVDYYVEKINNKHKVEWSKNFTCNGNLLIPKDITVLSNGDILVCSDYLNTENTYSIDIHRINKSANLIWKKTFGDHLSHRSYRIVSTNDLGCILAGKTTEKHREYPFVLKLDKSGQKLWQTKMSNDLEEVNDICEQNNHYFIASTVKNKNGTYDCQITNLDSKGSIIWQRRFKGRENDFSVSVKNFNGHIVMFATSYSSDGDFSRNYGQGDLWIFELNKKGETLRKECFGGSRDEQGQSLSITHKGYIITGITYSKDGIMKNNKKYPGYFVMKVVAKP